MSRCTDWLRDHPRWRQWGWFLALWCGGLGAALLLALPVKLIIHFAR